MGQGHTILIDSTLPDSSHDEREAFAAELSAALSDATVHLATDYRDAVERIETATIVISEYLSGEKRAAATDLQWVQATSAGVDHYDLEQFETQGIAITTASGVGANPIAEHVLGYMLHFERRFHRAVRQQAERRWEQFRGGELDGKTVGIVGVGAIGTRVAELASALNMTVLGVRNDPTAVPDAVDDMFGTEALHTVLGRSEYVVLACPLNEDTRHLIGIKELSSMSPSAVLINIARGGVVNQDHLTTALQSHDIRGAALDVTDPEPLPPSSPLWNLSNTLITPHTAGLTPLYLDRLADIFVDNYRRFTDDASRPLRNRVR